MVHPQPCQRQRQHHRQKKWQQQPDHAAPSPRASRRDEEIIATVLHQLEENPARSPTLRRTTPEGEEPAGRGAESVYPVEVKLRSRSRQCATSPSASTSPSRLPSAPALCLSAATCPRGKPEQEPEKKETGRKVREGPKAKAPKWLIVEEEEGETDSSPCGWTLVRSAAVAAEKKEKDRPLEVGVLRVPRAPGWRLESGSLAVTSQPEVARRPTVAAVEKDDASLEVAASEPKPFHFCQLALAFSVLVALPRSSLCAGTASARYASGEAQSTRRGRMALATVRRSSGRAQAKKEKSRRCRCHPSASHVSPAGAVVFRPSRPRKRRAR